MRNKVCCFDIAAIRVFTFSIEDLFVQFNVVIVDSIVKSDGDHLWYVSGRQVTGDDRAVFRTEAVGQHALRGIARRGSVGVVVDVYDKNKTILNMAVLDHTVTFLTLIST